VRKTKRHCAAADQQHHSTAQQRAARRTITLAHTSKTSGQKINAIFTGAIDFR
jgi:hypothetical protein